MLDFIKSLLTQNYYNKKAPQAFLNFYKYSCESDAYLEYCKKIHLTEYPVQNNLSPEQLKYLKKLLKELAPKKVLDLGCGTGHFLEALQEEFKFQGQGIDFALKKSFKNLIKADFENFNFKEKEYDIIYSIDSLYMINDISKVLSSINQSLKKNGKFIIFYTATKAIESTRLIKTLKKQNYKYDIKDFSNDDKYFWEYSLQTLTDLKESFRKEGNTNIWHTKYKETTKNIEFHKEGKLSRFCIVVDKES